MAEKLEAKFVFERETKNTYRFQEVGETDPIIGTLYIQKDALDEKPDKIKVTVEF
ncbi:unnamed protein product [marine sediment metagenome]|uniref:Uncharacterized protein n=1 Tax=marine sediment metagenome TaxID=412755 RepID=X1HXW1_9ZZZZ